MNTWIVLLIIPAILVVAGVLCIIISCRVRTRNLNYLFKKNNTRKGKGKGKVAYVLAFYKNKANHWYLGSVLYIFAHYAIRYVGLYYMSVSAYIHLVETGESERVTLFLILAMMFSLLGVNNEFSENSRRWIEAWRHLEVNLQEFEFNEETDVKILLKTYRECEGLIGHYHI